ncbi:MAG: acyltransferase [Sandarakinorhabdus sp.]|nr:acyltransferase [Sandarakinorhabdus sp.]
MFFVVSGIVIATNYAGHVATVGEWALFMRKRIARIYPLHLATLAFYVAIGLLVWARQLHPVDATRYDAAAIVPNLFLVHAWFPSGTISFNYVSWSVSAEFFVYLSFPLVALAVRGRPAISLLAIALLFAVFAVYAQTRIGLPLTRLGWQAGMLRAIPSFAFGVWIEAHRDQLSRLFAPYHPALLLKAGLVLLGVLMIVQIDQYVTLALIWVVVLLAYLCDRAAVSTWLSARWLAARGELTYSLYMLHPLVATVFLAVLFPRLLGTSLPARIVGVLAALPIVYLAAVLSLRHFENPVRRAINRWGDRRALSPQPGA